MDTRDLTPEHKLVLDILALANMDASEWESATTQANDLVVNYHNAVVEACARRMCFGCELDWPVEMLDHLRCHVAPTTMKHACKAQAILALKVKEGG